MLNVVTGKTTVLYKIKVNETITTIPTIGFNVETVSPVKGISFTVWDVGGQDKIRPLWKRYYQNADGGYKQNGWLSPGGAVVFLSMHIRQLALESLNGLK